MEELLATKPMQEEMVCRVMAIVAEKDLEMAAFKEEVGEIAQRFEKIQETLSRIIRG